VIKTPAALAALKSAGAKVGWSLPVKTKGLTARAEADGSVSFVDAKNVVASRLAAPKAWDAVVDPNSGEHTSTAPVAMGVTHSGKGRAVLTLTPDQGWLTDPARVFPITIDPTYASGGNVAASFDTYVSKAYPSATYSTGTELKVGTYNGGADAARSFLTFPLAAFKSKQIISASLSLYESWSWSCTARAFYVYNALGATSATSWSNQPAGVTNYGSLNVAKGFSSSCAAARVSVPITSLISAWSGSTSSAGGIRLHASETDNYGWKKFYSLETSQDPYITFTYNRKPNAATAPTVQTPPATSYLPPGATTAQLFTTDSTPLFSSKATDPDGNTVSLTTEVHTSTTTSATTLKSTCASAYVASGASASCASATALADSTLYYARTAVKDQLGLWNGTWSPWTSFYTAFSAPPAAKVTCPVPYLSGSWQDAAPTADITCTITAAGVAGNYATPGYIDVSVDGVVKPRVKITPSNDPNVAKTTVVVSKTSGGAHTVVATAVARTLKVSPATTYSFGWGNAGLTVPAAAPRVTTTGAIKIAASGPPRGTSAVPTAKVRWRVAGSSDNELVGWNDATTAPLTVTDNAAAGVGVTGSWNTAVETQDGALDSDPAAAGVQPTVLNPRVPVLLDVQVCLTYTAGTQCTWSSTKTSVLRVPHAFGNGFPTAAAGPGQVALFTGEFNTSATDVTVPGYTGDLSIGRSHSTFGNSTAAATDPTTSVFGPGWTAQLDGSDAGNAGLQVADGTSLDATIAFIDADGSSLVYSTPTGARRPTAALPVGTYPGVDEDTQASGTTLAASLVGGVSTLTLTEEDGTTTTFTALAEPASATTQIKFAPVAVAEPGSVGKTSYTRDTTGRVVRILAPVPPGVTCPAYPATTLNPGCRALRIVYAGATTATTTAAGDIAGQVSSTWLDIYDPAKAGGAGMSSIQVGTYKYDSTKRMVAQSDPRSTVAATTYAYDAGNHLTTIGAGGLTPLTLNYTGTDPKLVSVTRARPTGDPAGGTATVASFLYDVPTSGAGLPDLSQSAVDKWGQDKAPTYAAAVFGPDYTGSMTAPDYTYADLSYTDTAGYTINSANYGAGAWQRSAAEYDAQGNVVQTLDPKAIAAVIDGGTPGAADTLATTTVYNPTDVKAADGTTILTPAASLVTDVYAPARQVTLADGSVVSARPHTHTDYDQGAPSPANPATGVGYHLPTAVTLSAAEPDTGTDLETISTTLTGYSPIDAKP
ncbi:MAG: DNRLRE domain-containing protein, partial [Dermatophilaceae bacterium]